MWAGVDGSCLLTSSQRCALCSGAMYLTSGRGRCGAEWCGVVDGGVEKGDALGMMETERSRRGRKSRVRGRGEEEGSEWPWPWRGEEGGWRPGRGHQQPAATEEQGARARKNAERQSGRGGRRAVSPGGGNSKAPRHRLETHSDHHHPRAVRAPDPSPTSSWLDAPKPPLSA